MRRRIPVAKEGKKKKKGRRKEKEERRKGKETKGKNCGGGDAIQERWLEGLGIDEGKAE